MEDPAGGDDAVYVVVCPRSWPTCAPGSCPCSATVETDRGLRGPGAWPRGARTRRSPRPARRPAGGEARRRVVDHLEADPTVEGGVPGHVAERREGHGAQTGVPGPRARPGRAAPVRSPGRRGRQDRELVDVGHAVEQLDADEPDRRDPRRRRPTATSSSRSWTSSASKGPIPTVPVEQSSASSSICAESARTRGAGRRADRRRSVIH